jgi:hypothetical protein
MTGAKKFDGVFRSPNSGVPSWPGVTRTVLIFPAPGCEEWFSSALSEE